MEEEALDDLSSSFEDSVTSYPLEDAAYLDQKGAVLADFSSSLEE